MHRFFVSIFLWLLLQTCFSVLVEPAHAQNPVEKMRALQLQIQTQTREGDADGAVKTTRAMIDLLASLAGENHPQVVEARLLLIPQMLNAGKTDDALVEARQLLGRIESSQGKTSRLAAIAHDRLGMVYQVRREYAKATSQHKLAVDLLAKVGERETSQWAEAALNLSSALENQNDLVNARRWSEQSLAALSRMMGKSNVKTATALNNLGMLLLRMGENDAAENRLTESLKAYEAIYGAGHAELAISYSNLGKLFTARGKFDRAERNFQAGLKIAEQKYGDNHPTTANIQNNLGQLYLDQGDHENAKVLLTKSLAWRRANLGDDHPSTAITMHNLGTVLLQSGDYEQAGQHLSIAADSLESAGGVHLSEATDSRAWLGMLAALQDNPDRAIEQFNQTRRLATEFAWDTLPRLSTGEQQKLLHSPFFSTLNAALTLADRFPDNQKVIDASATWLANSKGIAEESFSRRITEQSNSEPSNSEEGTTDQSRPSIVSLQKIRDHIESGTVVVDFCKQDIVNFDATKHADLFTPPHYVAWILPSGSDPEAHVARIDLGPAKTIDQSISAVRELLQEASGPDGPMVDQGEVDATSMAVDEMRKVAEKVWEPIAEKIPDQTKRLIFIPDSQLWLLPWSALPPRTEDGSNRYLIEDFAISTTTSGRALAKERVREVTKRSPPVIFSNPRFNLNAPGKQKSFQDIFRRPARRAIQSQPAVSMKFRVRALPGTAVESVAILPNLIRWMESLEETASQQTAQPLNYKGKYALESVAKELKSPPLAVFATHGFFLDEQDSKSSVRSANPLDRCGLLLAGCNDPTSKVENDDGVLLGSEIGQIDFTGTKLVVLSACETGIGKIEDGNGVAGLRRAFHLAGAEQVASTLWQIPDFDTAKLMSEFFDALADGESIALAMQTAKRKRIQSRRERNGAAHPFFWAGFECGSH